MAAGLVTTVVLLGILLAFLTARVNSESRWLLLGAAVLAAVQSIGRLSFGNRLPRWTLHFDLSLDVLLGTIVCVRDRPLDVQFCFYYLWAIMFVAIYFSSRLFFVYYAYMAICFAFVDLLPGAPPGVAEIMWPLAGTGLLLGLTLLNLVSRLRYSGEVDALTNLANRRAWMDRAEQEFERAKRNLAPLSLVVIDVDDFKSVNDRLGHQAGDNLLKALADNWRTEIRKSGDFVARIGGDEFGFLATGTNAREVDNAVQRLRSLVPEGISCSFGIASWDGVSTLAEIFRAADEAMYAAKRARKLGEVQG